MAKGFDPYHKWLGIRPEEQPPDHYRLLGITQFESDPDVIDAAASKQAVYLQGCATGPHSALSQKLLNEVAAARLCLLNPKKKTQYDHELRDKLAAKSSAAALAHADVEAATTTASLDFLQSAESPKAPVKGGSNAGKGSAVSGRGLHVHRFPWKIAISAGVIAGLAIVGLIVGLSIAGSEKMPARTPPTSSSAPQRSPSASSPSSVSKPVMAAQPAGKIESSSVEVTDGKSAARETPPIDLRALLTSRKWTRVNRENGERAKFTFKPDGSCVGKTGPKTTSNARTWKVKGMHLIINDNAGDSFYYNAKANRFYGVNEKVKFYFE